jgi:3-hydroxymyristoyl/3-hydroxydecanoyl-(acyl carrier protein) dehydratase
MKWRFVDRVVAFEPRRMIRARKAVSLEEYYLLEPLGRDGAFPESCVVECCVEATRWLVAASSGFVRAAVLAAVSDFRFERLAGMGDVLGVDVQVGRWNDSDLSVDCHVTACNATVASGRLGLALVPLGEGFDPERTQALWHELYSAA